MNSLKQVVMVSGVIPNVTNRTFLQSGKTGLTDASGEFKRQSTTFRDSVSKDPKSKFPAEKGRYHLYVSYACPWGLFYLYELNTFWN